MKRLNKLFISALMLLAAVPTFAQEGGDKTSEFTLSGEVRPRTEVNHGNGNTGLMLAEKFPGYAAKGSYATSQRTRLNFDYKASKIKFGVSLQDVRVWGSQKQLVKNEDFATSLHQAWGEVAFTDEISLKAGRMELVYDDSRIFGNVGWAQQARSHDLAMFRYNGVVKADLGFGYHGAPYTGADAYNNMQFLHVSGKAADLKWSVLALNKGANSYQLHHSFLTTGDAVAAAVNENTNYSQTLGTYLKYKMGDLSLTFSGYYQMGKNAANWIDKDSLPTGMTLEMLEATGLRGSKNDGMKISAYYTSFEAMYKVMEGFKAGLGVELLSGNSYNYDATTGTYVFDGKEQKAFNPVFGTNHKFNGWMDYFYVGNHGGNVGLTDVYAKFIYKTGPLTFKLFPHVFLPGGKSGYNLLATDGTTVTQEKLGMLGTELDFAMVYKISKAASLQFGGSMMFASESMYALKGGTFAYDASQKNGTNYWAWTMLVLKPKFLNYTK